MGTSKLHKKCPYILILGNLDSSLLGNTGPNFFLKTIMAKRCSLDRLELQSIMSNAVQAYLNGKCSGGICVKEKKHIVQFILQQTMSSMEKKT